MLSFVLVQQLSLRDIATLRICHEPDPTLSYKNKPFKKELKIYACMDNSLYIDMPCNLKV